MELHYWFLVYLLESLFAYWILKLGGSEIVEGWKSFFLIHWMAPRWTADGIKVFVFLSWLASTLWFIIGLFEQEARDFIYL